MLLSNRLRHFVLFAVVALLVGTPAWAENPSIRIDEAHLVLQPPNNTTANCPVSGKYWSRSETTPKIKFQVRATKTNQTTVYSNAELGSLESGNNKDYYKLITGVGYDGTWTYHVQAKLINGDDQAVAASEWYELVVQGGED
jgi:hypothetical protein